MRIAVLDIGGTSVKSAVWDGQVLTGFKETDTNAREGGAALMRRAAGILKEYAPFDAAGISTAGQVDTDDGSIYYANPNIPDYTGIRVREILEEELSVPAAVENDVNAAALGELYYGAARGRSDFLCLTYGTGVGGAIVMNGEVCRGAHWSGGYFGGILVHPEMRRAGAELSGCYETSASVTALIEKARRIDVSLDDGKKIFKAFGRPEVRAVIDGWIDEIVYGLITLTHIFDPAMIVLGGGVMAQPYVTAEVRARTSDALEESFRDVQIVCAQLGNKAGLMGAAALAALRLSGKREAADG